MKRSAVSFSLKSKRKCELQPNSLGSCFNTEESDSYESPVSQYRQAIEDTNTICERLKSEGNTLAENSRFWEALSKFKSAIELQLEKKEGIISASSSQTLSVLHELCSQCYSELGEIYPAVESAEKAVSFNRICHLALQTLARAQINIGELYLAKKCIQRSLHIDPSCIESWDDMKHILQLIDELHSSKWSSLPVETRPGIVCRR